MKERRKGNRVGTEGIEREREKGRRCATYWFHRLRSSVGPPEAFVLLSQLRRSSSRSLAGSSIRQFRSARIFGLQLFLTGAVLSSPRAALENFRGNVTGLIIGYSQSCRADKNVGSHLFYLSETRVKRLTRKIGSGSARRDSGPYR